jgi:hypothetical protein
MSDPRFAQDMAFWNTTVELSKSKADIEGLLEKYNAQEFGCWTSFRGNLPTLVVRFIYAEMPFKVEYIARHADYSRGYKAREDLDKQSVKQMGRVAYNHIKALLQLAIDSGHQEMLMPYAALPVGENGKTQTLQHAGVKGLMQILADAQDGRLALPENGTGN